MLNDAMKETLRTAGWRPCKAAIGAIQCGDCQKVLRSEEDYWYQDHGQGDQPDDVRCLSCVSRLALFGGFFGKDPLADLFK